MNPGSKYYTISWGFNISLRYNAVTPPPLIKFWTPDYYGRDTLNLLLIFIAIRDGIQKIFWPPPPLLFFNCYRRGGSKCYGCHIFNTPPISNSHRRWGLKIVWPWYSDTPSLLISLLLEKGFKIVWPWYIDLPSCFQFPFEKGFKMLWSRYNELSSYFKFPFSK